MLTELIVRTYKGLAELALWVLIGIGTIVGYSLGRAAGFPLFGLLIGSVGTFLVLAIFLGAALLIADIHTRVGSIEKKLNGGQSSGGGGSAEEDVGSSAFSPVRADKIASDMSALRKSPGEIASQLESLGVSAADAAAQAIAVAFRGMEAQVNAAKVMAADGYSPGEIAERLTSQGVKRSDAAILAQYAKSGVLPASQPGSAQPAGDGRGHAHAARPAEVARLAEPPARRFCRACGHPQEVGVRFCEACGASSTPSS